MIPNNYKPSLTIPQQLPGYIRENGDYSTFITFLESYYEFLESNGNVIDVSRNILNYKDIDNTIDKFEEYFFNEFLQYFPKESLTSKKELVKFSRELYQRKSTPASFKFLFRALFNSDTEVVNAKDYVLIASGGKWNVSRFLKLNTLDERFLQTDLYKIFGETTKAVAKIESSRIVSGKLEIYLSDIVRNFSSGEFVKIVDDQLNDVLFDGEVLRAKIIGIVPKITIIPGYEGSSYLPGDPVIVFGGLNPENENPIKATAEVETVGAASLKTISVLNGSNGFRTFPNTIISIVSDSGTGAEARVASLDANNAAVINYIPLDIIEPYSNTALDAISYGFPTNPLANGNTILSEAFNLVSLSTFPILSLELITPGSNFISKPSLFANSYFEVSDEIFEIGPLGILKPIQIRFGGHNYSNGDIINVVGGSGYGAYANVKSVNATGNIEEVQYINNPNDLYTLGGIQYTETDLPTIAVESSNNKVIYLTTSNTSYTNSNTLYFTTTSNVVPGMFISGLGIPGSNTFNYFDTSTTVNVVGANYIEISGNLTQIINPNTVYKVDGTALLYVDGILGRGATFDTTTDRIGEVKTIKVTNQGEDYISNPSVSLKVADIALINVNELLLPEENDVVYQGDAELPTFKAIVESITILPDNITRTFNLRIFSYNGSINNSELLYIDRTSLNSKEISLQIRNTYNENRFINGIKFYGDGGARANAEFSSGIISGSGNYLNTDGFLSYSNYLESELINEYSYFLVVEKEFSKYKELLYDILHPTAKQAVTYNAIKNPNAIDLEGYSQVNKEISLKAVTREEVYGVLTSPSTLQIYDLRKDLTEISLSMVISSNDQIHIESDNGEIFYSRIESIDDANDIIYLTDANALEYSNVAYGFANGNNFVVTSFTGFYDFINGGIYSDPNNKLKDIVYVNDYFTIPNNTIQQINSIDYPNNIIYVSSELNYSGNTQDPELMSVTRQFSSNNIYINYNLDYKYMLGYGNTVTNVVIDGFELLDENNNLVYIPLKL
nr:MAG: hypothetical protein [Caudoviricetes sp.]